MAVTEELIKDPEAALAFTLSRLKDVDGADTIVTPYSGGKDSTTVIQSLLVLIKQRKLAPPRRLILILADTRMEFWPFLDHATSSLKRMRRHAEDLGIEAHDVIVQSVLQDDFFYRIIGLGMTPPTANMRWCTDKLKIQAVRKMLNALGATQAPVLLGVRYGESRRRDGTLDRQILSCTVGGECGPDAMTRNLNAEWKVQPIDRWRQCAVFDFLQFVAPSYGFDNTSLIQLYGPDLDLRYGCWSCPLIFHDKTAEYLKTTNPILTELMPWVATHFHKGGQAWRPENREFFLKQDARLSLRYCRQLFDDLLSMGARYGVPLLNMLQIQAIQAAWRWRKELPDYMQGHDIHMRLDLEIPDPKTPPLRISQVCDKTAHALATANLEDDTYHYNIKTAACALNSFTTDSWKYLTQWNGGTTLWSCLNDPNKSASVKGYTVTFSHDRLG